MKHTTFQQHKIGVYKTIIAICDFVFTLHNESQDMYTKTKKGMQNWWQFTSLSDQAHVKSSDTSSEKISGFFSIIILISTFCTVKIHAFIRVVPSTHIQNVLYRSEALKSGLAVRVTFVEQQQCVKFIEGSLFLIGLHTFVFLSWVDGVGKNLTGPKCGLPIILTSQNPELRPKRRKVLMV